jgi:glutathione S-transferase
MNLFCMPGASSLADHIVLEWSGAEYETVRMDRCSLKGEDYLALNPSGSVPLLVDGDFALTENVAILVYLAELHPHARLLGDGSLRSRAEVMRWLGFLNSDVHKAFRPIFYPERYLQGGEFAQHLAATARGHVRDYLQRLDAQLEGREWLTGERSVADAYLFVMLRWAIGTKVGLQGFANLSRFVRRLHDDEGVHAALAMEEGLAPRRDSPPVPSEVLRRIEARLHADGSATLTAEVVGTVEYREGDGPALELRRGLVEVDVTRLDTVLSWVDENYRGEAAMPLPIFMRYVGDGAIRLAA